MAIHTSVYNSVMERKSKRIRKNIMVNPDLVKRARNILGAPNDSQAIELCLESIADRKTNEEMWDETKKLIKRLHNPNFKPLFS